MVQRSWLVGAVLLLCLAPPRPARAQCPGTYLYQQPDQTDVGIPCTSALQGYLDGQGENLDAIQDASLVPETFHPALQLTFTLIAEGAGYENVFGWYNVGDDVTLEENRHPVLFSGYDHGSTDPCDGVDADPIPPQNQCNHRTLVLCQDGVRHPDWKGGPIGFFLVSPEGIPGSDAHNDVAPDYGYIYYSEPRLNILEQNYDEPYIHHLVYQSTVDPTAFYFGFEDLFRGGDNDFEDMLIKVEGLLVEAPAELCNDFDDDCDGLIDENVTEPCSTACGQGVRICEAGVFGTCTAPKPQSEECNGIDDDCDDLVDEALTRPCSNECGDGVEYCVNGGWFGCTAPEPAPEECDNLDNDCDDLTDEDLLRACFSDCGEGEETCVNGSWVDCTAVQPAPEECDGVDNDCDGLTDEDLVLACATACGPGQRVCTDGQWADCDAQQPVPERCDGLDNDCDGLTDEVWTQLGDPCEVWQGGCSAYGEYICNADGSGITCSGQVEPHDEVCNGSDDDCDGAIDETDPDLGNLCGTCDPGEDPPCYSTEGECRPGNIFCIDGILVCLGEIGPTEEICDQLDNDCDGLTDENAEPEICDDGIDNDCDGKTDIFDEECSTSCIPGEQEPCGISEGDCEMGVRTCGPDGNWGDCEGAVGPTNEVCDDRDNDCDGLTDEDAVPEVCDDGIDNDCDGFIDMLDDDCGECTPGERRPCGSDVGECQFGQQVCNPQGLWGECSGEIGPEPESCNGQDDDCDGMTDEGDLCGGYDVCLCGECVSACSAGECPAGDKVCVNGWCVTDPCCGVQCPAGTMCDPATGQCHDPCIGITCPDGHECRLGECVPVDCTSEGHACPAGQRCVGGVCQADPCAGVDCPDGSYCHEGVCLEVGCNDCTPDQICQDGVCTESPCAGILCQPGQVCIDGICAADPCQGVACPRGWVCRDGTCVPDPCWNVACPDQSVCLDGFCVAADEEPDGGTDADPDAGVDAGPDAGSDAGSEDKDGGDRPADTAGGESEPAEDNAGGCGCSGTNGSEPANPWAGAGLAMLAACSLLGLRHRRVALVLMLLAAVFASACSSPAPGAPDANVTCNSSADCQEGFICRSGDCVPRPACTDLDGDGFCDSREGCAACTDCNDNRDDINPDADEICDDIDNDCDGEIDEGCPCTSGEERPCGTNVGACRQGTSTCQDGQWGPCTGGVEPAAEENCSDELDNDCDGVVNEGCACVQGATRLCGSNLGQCTFGVQNCIQQAGDWVWGPCTGGSPPVDEVCGDDIDNDCDGALDNGCACGEQETRYCGLNLGICHAGLQHCVDGVWQSCVGARWPEDEICDGLDNNCNRLVDEGCDCVDGTFRSCGQDEGLCQRGTQHCVDGTWGMCDGEVPPSTELCDGRDNDCDGTTDEEFADLREPCQAGTGVCARPGIMVCNQDQTATVCSATPGEGAEELCDGLDNDCDGDTDEEFPDVGGACTVGQGECANTGIYVCDPHGGMTCNVSPLQPEPDRCDGLDNDCDGSSDENYPLLGLPCTSGLGVCQNEGVYICSADGLSMICDAAPGSGGPEECDNLDNDCDGTTDEDITRTCTNQCGDGVESCFQGTWVGCTAPLPVSEICDGEDNDCDGSTDEDFDFATDLEHCGGCLRPCAPPHGTGECIGGTCLVSACDAGHHDLNGNAIDGCEYACSVQGNESCNGVDDDCDGTTDEDPGAPGITCLDQGVCAAIQPRCTNGGWQCPYPDTYEASETLCDNLDNDCDGEVDEDYPDKNAPCAAGAGVCRRNGVMVCAADGQATECSATADTSQQSAEICDDLDNDCDGLVDNGLDWQSEMIQIDMDGTLFWIDRHEASRPDATEGERGYKTGYACARPDVLPWDDVTWSDAQAACQARGKRLCTDAEWLYACATVDELAYPYGDVYQSGTCNEFDQHGGVLATGQLATCTNAFGLLDLSGNVAEWADCADALDCRFVRPIFGGDYDDAIVELVTCWFRNNAGPQVHQTGLGFRCCRDP